MSAAEESPPELERGEERGGLLGVRLGEELSEIKARAFELNQRLREALGELDRIEGAQGRTAGRRSVPISSPAEDGAGPLVAFVHIPKTAGATVTSIFAAAYSRKGITKAGNYMTGPEESERKITKRPGGWENWHRRGGRISVGHVPYGLFRKHLPADTRYMTFLREPVDRVLSHYYRHVQRREGDPIEIVTPRQARKVKADSLEEALVELNLPQLNNLATRFLCGNASPIGKLPASALDDAKENLRRFAFVGIQERFEESVVLLQRMLGLDSVPYQDRHVSVEGRRPAVDEIPGEQRALIAERNRLDQELYGFGLRLFEEAVAAADDGFRSAVEALQAESSAAREEAWRAARLAPAFFLRKRSRTLNESDDSRERPEAGSAQPG